MSTAVQLMLSKEALTKILQSGVGDTFTQFSVSDAKQRYDVTDPVNLTTTFPGGERKAVTVAPTCKNSNDRPITKQPPTVKELKDSTLKLQWEIGRTDCDEIFVGSNIKVTVNLRTYFNYLLSKLGQENWAYDNKSTLTIIDSIVAIQKQFEPATYEYNEVNRVTGLDIKYIFDSKTSFDNYVSTNAYLMSVTNGEKRLIDNTKTQKFPSLLELVAHTKENQKGSANTWALTLTPISYGYVGILASSKETTYRKSDYYTINEIESMSIDEINRMFKMLAPAAITSYTNSEDDLYVFNDFSGTYAVGVDNLTTMAYRFFNVNGRSLLEGIINKVVNNIQATYTEGPLGVYTKQINFHINNTNVNEYKYKSDQINGGMINLVLTWDGVGSDNMWSNIISYE